MSAAVGEVDQEADDEPDAEADPGDGGETQHQPDAKADSQNRN